MNAIAWDTWNIYAIPVQSKNEQRKEIRVEKPMGKLPMESDSKPVYFYMQVEVQIRTYYCIETRGEKTPRTPLQVTQTQ